MAKKIYYDFIYILVAKILIYFGRKNLDIFYMGNPKYIFLVAKTQYFYFISEILRVLPIEYISVFSYKIYYSFCDQKNYQSDDFKILKKQGGV